MGDFVSHARKRFWLRRILGNLCLIFALSRIAVGDYGVIPFIGLPLGMHLMFNWLFDSLMSFGDVRG